MRIKSDNITYRKISLNIIIKLHENYLRLNSSFNFDKNHSKMSCVWWYLIKIWNIHEFKINQKSLVEVYVMWKSENYVVLCYHLNINNKSRKYRYEPGWFELPCPGFATSLLLYSNSSSFRSTIFQRLSLLNIQVTRPLVQSWRPGSLSLTSKFTAHNNIMKSDWDFSAF